ncbi:MAG: dihydrodipicolinate synthase family protein, partial [Candidatus Eremiobacteraeota bacterium]|nr:dihydrodipicolinate synthase family protein [Candidatus Eremiobacteraeota bacterium]
MSELSGPIGAVLTPLTADLQPDAAKACIYYRKVLDGGCAGLNVMGTSGEAMSFSASQRVAFMTALAQAGLPLSRMMVGTGSVSLGDAILLTRTALELGFAGVLVMPPFFYRGVSEEGLVAFFDRLRTAANIPAARLFLYNFPAMSGTTFTVELVRRLSGVVPIEGYKDSSNDPALQNALHEAFPKLRIFSNSEGELLRAQHEGLAGCISGTVALWPQRAATLWEN